MELLHGSGVQTVISRSMLEAAVRRAAGRSDGVVAVQPEDMTECLKDVLNNSISSISVSFLPIEARHVRIAS